jgi:dTDP-4-amino-4,6-dideoxygalactose transaminase
MVSRSSAYQHVNMSRETANKRESLETQILNRDDLPHWPMFAEDERAAVEAVLASGKVNYWTGRQSRDFEDEYARFLGTTHAVGLSNGTVALELALRAWGIGPGDEVIVTPRSFIASVSCVVAVGARPVFVDVDRHSGNISAETIEPAITANTRAIVPVHLGGYPCDLDPVLELADAHRIKVLEDCAQAHGAVYRGRPVGSIGHAGAFSFCQDKIISTGGEGGLLATSDQAFWERAWSYKDHGKSWQLANTQHSGTTFRWLHDSFGTNWRITEMQSAIGRLQLRKLPTWSERRRCNASILLDGLEQVPGIRVPRPPTDVEHAYYRWYAYIEPQDLRSSWNRDRIVAEICDRGVPCLSGSCPEIYLEAAFERSSNGPQARLPVARELGETSIALLVHPTLSPGHMHAILDTVFVVLRQAVR